MTSVGRGSVASRVEQRTERAIDEGHLAVVGLRAVLRGEIRGRFVRRVRVEHVHPGEELRRLMADPVQRAGHDQVGAPLGHRDLDGAARLRHLVVVDVEPRRQPEALGERKPADERAGGEAARLEPGSQRRRARA